MPEIIPATIALIIKENKTLIFKRHKTQRVNTDTTIGLNSIKEYYHKTLIFNKFKNAYT